MKTEKNYDFRSRMKEYHLRYSRDLKVRAAANEIMLNGSWSICCVDPADVLVNRAAFDLARFLQCCMDVKCTGNGTKKIILSAGRDKSAAPGCIYHAAENEIHISGVNPRGTLFGVIQLEERMRLRQAPLISLAEKPYIPLARMRSTHSGSGLDDFPDWQLDCILHAGFTAIDLFVSGIDTAAKGHYDIGDLIDRAAGYGLDVVLYNYQTCYVHPDDPDSDAEFDRVFGQLFRAYPKAAAISLCGESLEFPSRDKTTIKKSEIEVGTDGLQDVRQPTGYYPNSDYPAYLAKLRDAVHRAAPGAEVIFSTYNWGWAPVEARKKFLQSFPENMTLQVTYDIFKKNRRGNLACPLMDYSIFAEEPGEYFTTEVEAAAEAGLRNIRVTSNLAGATWDFGCVPYAPVPFRWLKRMQILKSYLQKYSVNSFYDSHHFGWFPNICNDLARAVFADEEPEEWEVFFRRIAARDYGESAAESIVEVWKIWSSAMDHYVGSNEDQYGPWRVGPSYPFVFHPAITRTMDEKYVRFPFTKNAYRCDCMVKTMYQPFENDAQSPGPLRFPVEIRELNTMLDEWNKGVKLLSETVKKAEKREEAERLLALGTFIRNMIRTTAGIKKWRMANLRLQCAADGETMLKELETLFALLQKERANVEETIPLAEFDSRLGWEPRMDYVCDKAHLQWKLRQLDIAEAEMKIYRDLIRL